MDSVSKSSEESYPAPSQSSQGSGNTHAVSDADTGQFSYFVTQAEPASVDQQQEDVEDGASEERYPSQSQSSQGYDHTDAASHANSSDPVTQEPATVDQYQNDVKARAGEILENNKMFIDDIQKKYEDPNSPAWKSLEKAMTKDQELASAEYEAYEKLQTQEHYFVSMLNIPGMDVDDVKQMQSSIDEAKENYENIKSAIQVLRNGYPEIVALDVYNDDVKGFFSKSIDLDSSNEEIGQAMAAGFDKIKDDIDEAIDEINNDDVPLETLSLVLGEVKADPKYSEIQDDIDEWIEGEKSKDKWINIATNAIATVAGLGSLAFGGWGAFALAGIGAGASAGGAVYNFERSKDLYDVAQAQRVGDQVSATAYDGAKFNLVMAGVDLVLSGADVVAVGKAFKGLSNVTDASALSKEARVLKENIDNSADLAYKSENVVDIGGPKKTPKTKPNEPSKTVKPNRVSPTPLELVQQAPGQPKRIAKIKMDHVLDGEVKTHVNNSGKVFKRGVGGHYPKSSNIRVAEVIEKADKNGVVKARIKVRDPETGKWVNKKAPNDLFSDHWSRRQVTQEVKEAFYNSKPISNSMWEGRSPSGVKIRGYYNTPDGSASTAWPVHGGK